MSQEGHNMSHNSFQDEVKMAKMSQTRAQMWARRAKMGPRWAKIPPRAHREGWDSHAAPPQKSKENRWFFNVFSIFWDFGSKMRPRCAKIGQERRKMSQERRKMSQDRCQDGPRSAQDGANMTQDVDKMHLMVLGFP